MEWNSTFREENKCRFQTGPDFVLLSGLYLCQGSPDFTGSNLKLTYGLSPRPGSYLNYSRLVHRKLCSKHESNYQLQSGNWMATGKIIWDTRGVGGKGSRGRSGERTMICVVIKRRRSIVIEQAGLEDKVNAGCLPLCWGMLSIDLLLSLQKMSLTDKMHIGRGRRASDGSGD